MKNSRILRWTFTVTRLKYLLAIFVAASWYVAAFLAYLLPIFSDWLQWIGFVAWVAAFFFSLSALFRRQWRAATTFAVMWLVVALPFLGITEQFSWLRAQGFRIHAWPAQDYLSRCRLTEFVEKGINQALGECEHFHWSGVAYIVFYDTTGELALPVSRRTPEWKDAMWHYPPKKVLLEGEDRAQHLLGSFYEVGIGLEEFDGDSTQ